MRTMRTIKKTGWGLIGKCNLLSVAIIIFMLLPAGNAAASELEEPAGPAANPNYALQYDGADDFVRVLDIGNFDFDTTFTVEAWVRPDSVAGTGLFKAIVTGRLDDRPNSGGGWSMSLPKDDHSQWGLSVCTPQCNATRTTAGSLVVGEWQHLAATYDGTTIHSYQDGVLVDSVAHAGNVTDINYLFIGALLSAFHGTIDEVRVWNIARSREEILSTIFSSLKGDEAGLAGYWNFDDGSGQFASDSSGNGQVARLGSIDGVDAQDPLWVASDSPIIPPNFQLTPLFAGLGTDIGISTFFSSTIFNCGWSPGETVEIWWDKPEAQLASFTVDAKGCFEGMFPLDDGERIPGSEPGTHEVQARGSVTGVLTSPFEQFVPQLHLNPARGPAERVVGISGCGWDGANVVTILLQPTNDLLARPAVDPSTGCIDDTMTIPRKKDGFYSFFATSDVGQVTGAAYWVKSATIFLTPNEGPAGASVPLAGCGWFPEEQIDFEFSDVGVIFDTWGTSIGGCITSGGPTEPTLLIPADATLGARTILATGVDSGEIVNVPFNVIERSLAFDPDFGLPGDSIAASGCGWVGNDQVTVEWGYPDTNNLPIRWLADVDATTACFGLAGDFLIEVPANTINGEVVETATGDTIGTAEATFTVGHDGRIEIPVPDGVAGGMKTVNIFDAIVGETISFKWDSGTVPFDGVGAATPDLSYDITLPDSASVGLHTVTAAGTKGFDDQASVNILDTAQISVVTGGEIRPGDLIRVEGTEWAAEERISFELQKGGESWPITEIVTVAAGSLEFSELLALPSPLPSGLYTLVAQGDKGRDAETSVTITALVTAFSLTAAYADPPPDLDGILRGGEWDYGQKANFTNGFIAARSDETRLYILLDLLSDTGNDNPGDDNFWLSFDIWDDQRIDSGWDLNFRLDSGGDFILEEYIGPNSFSPRNSVNLRSAYAAGFGCNMNDGSLSIWFDGFIPRFNCSNHRLWEIAIDLDTISAEPGDVIRLGVRTLSQSPSFSEDNPAGFPSDFSELGAITLAPSQLDPSPPSGAVTGIGSNGFEVEVTQAIQDVNNDLRLVADKETVVRVYPETADEAMVRVFLFGQKNSQDLPGSPLVTLATVPASIDREALNETANFLLPATWVTEGITEFTAVAENLDGSNVTAVQESVVFYERRVPVIWVFPFNEGTKDATILPAQADMVAQERVLEGLVPTPEVTFIHRPWTDIGITGRGEIGAAVAVSSADSNKGMAMPDSDQAHVTTQTTGTVGLTLTKEAKPPSYGPSIKTIKYIYKVTTSGPSLVRGPITVTDDKETVSCPQVKTVGNNDGNLDPDETLKCTASHTVVQADVDALSITNTATAFGDSGNVMSGTVELTAPVGIAFSTMKKELNNYWTMLSLAKFLSGDTSAMPDLLYGFKVSRDPEAVGTSDPVYSGGRGRVVVGQADGRDFNSTTMVHEVNHDLDRSRTGTWGKHVANPKNVKDRTWGCDAGGPDLSWPYTGNDSIQEVGFDATNPWDDGTGGHLTVLPTNRNDFMSYCWHKGTPIQWISPYRWQAMFANFTPAAFDAPSAALAVEPVYYISGQLNLDGSGSLDPIQQMPGAVSTDIAPGEYSIEIQNGATDVLLAVPFMASFTDVEGVELDTVYFNFQLPVQANVAMILLKHNEEILDTIIPSLNPPTAELLAPLDGDNWEDQEIIQWTASDADGDPMQFTILYSPDEGGNWYPVASNLTGNEYIVDVSRLPGGTSGKVMLIVTDGFHTVQVQSAGTFTVPHPAPIVVIDTPADGESFLVNEWINLSGSANDAAGTDAGDFSYVWSIDGEAIAVGSEANTLLEEGSHTITLAAYDVLDNYGEASIQVNLAPLNAPHEPNNPTPEHGATDALVISTLGWSGGDPDGDPVTYDVYLEADNETPAILVCDDTPSTSCIPPAGLLVSTQYYWRVVARDEGGATREGAVWRFETEAVATDQIILSDGFE